MLHLLSFENQESQDVAIFVGHRYTAVKVVPGWGEYFPQVDLFRPRIKCNSPHSRPAALKDTPSDKVHSAKEAVGTCSGNPSDQETRTKGRRCLSWAAFPLLVRVP